MTSGQATQTTENIRNFTLSTEIFHQPNLDIYAQMAYIVLRSFPGGPSLPTLSDISQLGRMSTKQATRALQRLAELKVLPHKLFRQMIGEFSDDRLSWGAKGLLTYLKEHPEAGIGELSELSSQSGEDEHSIRRALTELKRCGYLEDYPELSKLVKE